MGSIVSYAAFVSDIFELRKDADALLSNFYTSKLQYLSTMYENNPKTTGRAGCCDCSMSSHPTVLSPPDTVHATAM
jgi:hypothetical protein